MPAACELSGLVMHSRKGYLPEWKVALTDSNLLYTHELFGQYESAVVSAVPLNNKKFTHLKMFVTGKPKQQ